ncbi:hypothetical protein BJ912DRAFT_494053 [Pholiota molesta]|nr:hypothetical protein BJ912DRAFT_494053 [Pholiota molesta]
MRSFLRSEISSILQTALRNTKIIHGDINLNSLKCRKIDGKIYGVLIDYDLSEQGPNLKQRMGTMPYMAVDLLEPTPTKHLYRYDLESLFYVFAVLVTRYDRGEVIENPPLQNWFELPPSSLRPKKVPSCANFQHSLHPPLKTWRTFCSVWG